MARPARRQHHKGDGVKAPHKKLSGSAWRKIFEITNRCGKYAPRQVAKRRQFRREGLNHAT